MRLAQWLRHRPLQEVRLHEPGQPRVTIYIGNEAGDLDSGELFDKIFINRNYNVQLKIACCALALAYAMEQKEQSNGLHLPFLHYPKVLIILRC